MAEKVCSVVVVVALICICEILGTQLNRTYVINLDLPPEQRWLAVGKDFPDLKEFTNLIKRTVVPPKALPIFDKMLKNITNYLPQVYVQEIQGLADAAGGTFEDFLITNLIYEITVTCTGIVAQDEHGQILHGRNLDYQIFPETMKKLSIYADFQRNNKTVYTSVHFAGLVGVLTAIKPNAYSVQMNQRDQGTSRIESALVAYLHKDASVIMFKLRDMLDTVDSYDDAVEYLSGAVFIAPCYFVIAGAHPGEGAVLTRDRTFTSDIWLLDPYNERWYIVQTNYDHWLPDPVYDNRQTWAMEYMDNLGQGNVTANAILNIMTADHVRVGLTVYSSILSAAHPELLYTEVHN